MPSLDISPSIHILDPTLALVWQGWMATPKLRIEGMHIKVYTKLKYTLIKIYFLLE